MNLKKEPITHILVSIAIKNSLSTQLKKETIAVMNVISMTRLTRGNQAMERSNLEQYLLSIQPAKSMRDEGIITHQEYSKIELFLAEKYCIKKGNLYRQIDLTIPRNKVIDIVPVKEVKSDEKNYDNRHITKIAKED
ncbi:MAG: hypothetical protein IH571_06725 [Acholeplasmataceae bacterium]|nr:hypothetical protein [Acholeplasmataceae bacterium]